MEKTNQIPYPYNENIVQPSTTPTVNHQNYQGDIINRQQGAYSGVTVTHMPSHQQRSNDSYCGSFNRSSRQTASIAGGECYSSSFQLRHSIAENNSDLISDLRCLENEGRGD